MSSLEQFSHAKWKNGKIKVVKSLKKRLFPVFSKKSAILENSIIEYQNKTNYCWGTILKFRVSMLPEHGPYLLFCKITGQLKKHFSNYSKKLFFVHFLNVQCYLAQDSFIACFLQSGWLVDSAFYPSRLMKWVP